MVRAPSAEDEDRRRLTRERGTLLKERIQHTNRIKGLLSGQGIRDYNPLRRDRFERLEGLRTGDGRELPSMLKAEIRRELERIVVVTTQLAAVERARDALIRTDAEEPNNPAAMLLKLKGLGPEFASLLWRNRCSAASPIDARWRPTAAWRPAPGRASASNGIRASRSQAIAACARP
jgi:transposase